MNNYKKGVKLERDVIRIFKENGYIAFRSAGSHSPFDVVLVKQTEENQKICFVAFVQCKVKRLEPGKTGLQAPREILPEQLSKLLSKS